MFNLFAQTGSTAHTTVSASMLVLLLLVVMVVDVITFAVLWIIFRKAGRKGWLVVVPIYNTWVLFELCGKPGWWALLCFIPGVGVVLSIISLIELAKRFGKSGGFAVFMALLPFIGLPILAFSKAQYHAKPVAESAGA